MADCCVTDLSENRASCHCPTSGTNGRKVGLITLKALLKSSALEKLKSQRTYMFCPESSCEVVYFTHEGDVFQKSDLKVLVYQKDSGEDVPVCYCFGWTRTRIRDEIKRIGKSTVVRSIKQNVKDGKCGCEVNNPQGSCCLGNVSKEVKNSESTIADV